MTTEQNDPYKPWSCNGGHKLTIKQIAESGECGLCGGEVIFSSCKEEVAKVILEEANAPLIYIIDARGRKLRLRERECRFCHGIFETPYVNNPFCSTLCKVKYDEEKLLKRPRCRVCGKLIEAPDRRWKYCSDLECGKYRRGKTWPE